MKWDMQTDKYNMAFTTGGLFLPESTKIAELYLDAGDWEKVRSVVISENLLQLRTASSVTRISREICSRLATLSNEELDLVAHGTIAEQRYLLWLAICRRYRFIREFAVELVRERFLSLRHDLNRHDFDSFYNTKAEWHPELDKITPATRSKLRQVLFRMLREADLLTTDNTINPALLTQRVITIIGCNEPEDLNIFPITEAELRRWIK
jgi:hypothetical protein